MPVLAALVPAAIGIYQGIAGAIQNKKALNKLQNQQTPMYTPNKAISDYYNEAYNRYNTASRNTALSQNISQNANRTQATNLNAMQNWRSGLGALGTITRGTNDALLKGAVAGEQQRNVEFNQLGHATGMLGQEGEKMWHRNALAPYEANRQLYGLEASGGAATMNAGISNAANAIGNAASIWQAQKMYGQTGGGGGGGIGGYTSVLNRRSYLGSPYPQYDNIANGAINYMVR